MTTMSPDRKTLHAAYTEAEYWIDAEPPLRIAIGAPSAALDAILAHHSAQQGALITAANPGSRITPEQVNAAAHAALLAELAQRQHRWLATRSIDPAGQWPEEPGVFVPGISREQARAVAALFGQNAFVWCRATRAPRLCWTAG